MPFPPTFTNVYDTTFPPDTQLANLLGQDLRNFRTDVMQRLSLLSGTLANRPTPEIVNATWGGVGYGLLYFSTDSSQIFQWNGAVWNDVTQSLIKTTFFKDNITHLHTGTVTEDVVYTNVINGGLLGTSNILRATLVFTPTALVSGGSTIRFKYGGNTPFFYVVSIAGQVGVTYRIDFTMGNQGVTNSQKVTAAVNGFPGTPATQVTASGTLATDSTVNQNFVVTAQNGAAGDSQSFLEYFLEIL